MQKETEKKKKEEQEEKKRRKEEMKERKKESKEKRKIERKRQRENKKRKKENSQEQSLRKDLFIDGRKCKFRQMKTMIKRGLQEVRKKRKIKEWGRVNEKERKKKEKRKD